SPAGNDAADGTRQHPFATLERARDAARQARAAAPGAAVTVWVGGGTFSIRNTFALDARDSGRAIAPVTYRAVPGETPRLMGGRQLPREAFRPVTDDHRLARLDPAARANVLVADL